MPLFPFVHRDEDASGARCGARPRNWQVRRELAHSSGTDSCRPR